jgi:hypothetical protein
MKSVKVEEQLAKVHQILSRDISSRDISSRDISLVAVTVS